jgi:hypothetical protein
MQITRKLRVFHPFAIHCQCTTLLNPRGLWPVTHQCNVFVRLGVNIVHTSTCDGPHPTHRASRQIPCVLLQSNWLRSLSNGFFLCHVTSRLQRLNNRSNPSVQVVLLKLLCKESQDILSIASKERGSLIAHHNSQRQQRCHSLESR